MSDEVKQAWGIRLISLKTATIAAWLIGFMLAGYGLLFVIVNFFDRRATFAIPSLLVIGIFLLFSIGTIAALHSLFFDRDPATFNIDLGSKLKLTIKSQHIKLLLAVICIGMGLWFTSREIDTLRRFDLVKEGDYSQKPAYVSHSEWYLMRGLAEYSRKNFDAALSSFDQISELPEPLAIRWKFYQSMARLRILEHRKFRLLESVDNASVDKVTHTLGELMAAYPNDKHAEAIAYWYAQTIYHFNGNSGEALAIFQRLRAQYKWGIWKQGCVLYSAEIHAARGTAEDLIEAQRLLLWLMTYHAKSLVRLVPEGRDYRVDEIVPPRFKRVRAAISNLHTVTDGKE